MPRPHVVTRRRALPLALLAALTAAGVALAAAGDITTVAGGGGNDGDAAALSARLRKPRRVAWLPGGGMLISEFGEVNNGNSPQYGDGRIRELKNGQVTTVAGDGVQGFKGDGGPALAAEFDGPSDVAVIPGTSDYLVADEFNSRVEWSTPLGISARLQGTGITDAKP
ncbi:MAG: hypothetical protein U0Y82_09665 [Thermoleophilia bacterium]